MRVEGEFVYLSLQLSILLTLFSQSFSRPDRLQLLPRLERRILVGNAERRRL